jgi:DNA-binding transcriptional MerR regulator
MYIGELSRQTGTSVRMLRYYESQGLLRSVRLPSGYRTYGEADVLTVKRIRALNAAGLTLSAIRRMLPCARPGSMGFAPCTEVRDGLSDQIARLDSLIRELVGRRRILADYLAEAIPAEQAHPIGETMRRPELSRHGRSQPGGR